MAEMNVIEMDIDDIIPYENNPRRNEKAVDAVVNSIREFGFKNPIILDENHVIISGHTRRLAALRMGLKTVPCYIASDLTDEQVRAFRLADNRVASIAVWDDKKLKEEIADVMTIDLGEFGFSKDMIEDVIKEQREVKTHTCPKCGYEWS